MRTETWAAGRGSKHPGAVNPLGWVGEGSEAKRRAKGSKLCPLAAEGRCQQPGVSSQVVSGTSGGGGAKKWKGKCRRGSSTHWMVRVVRARGRRRFVSGGLFYWVKESETPHKFQNAMEGTKSFKVFFSTLVDVFDFSWILWGIRSTLLDRPHLYFRSPVRSRRGRTTQPRVT